MNEQYYLRELVETVKTDVINSMQAKGRYATGQTIKALEITEWDGQVQLLAPGYVDHLDRGRGLTSPNAPRSEPSLKDRIKEWCAAKGIDEAAVYPITMSIHKYGYKSSDDNLNRRADEVAGKLATLFTLFSMISIDLKGVAFVRTYICSKIVAAAN